MSRIGHAWDMVGRCFACDYRSTASKDELWGRIQIIWDSLPQADIQHLFYFISCRIAALIAARGGHTKANVGHLILFCYFEN
ncbi:hypothetical protein TNCV_1267641 [Trichonephila clavipes]|nr:hypothetical protein TNCV_1267641 [Trichonephila clavipes]